MGLSRFRFGPPFLDVEFDQTTTVDLPADLGEVIAAVEVQRADIDEEPSLFEGGQGWFEHGDVVAVCSVQSPGDRYSLTVDRE